MKELCARFLWKPTGPEKSVAKYIRMYMCRKCMSYYDRRMYVHTFFIKKHLHIIFSVIFGRQLSLSYTHTHTHPYLL